MKVEGACHCGAITFEAEIDPEQVVICHCTDCQTLSGSVYRTVAFAAEEKFLLLSGRPKVYVKLADSGNRREQTFCGTCGTPIYSAPNEPAGSRVLGIRVGTLKQRTHLVPNKQYFKHGSALGWVDDLSAIEVAGDFSG